MTVALLLLLAQATASASPEPDRPAITIQQTETPGARLFYLNLPWAPYTFDDMERPGNGYYNRRAWPFARLETARPLALEGTSLPPGNYALLFHPNTPDRQGMSLEVRKIASGEFLEPGNVMTPVPDGETIWRGPVRFDTAAPTASALRIEMLPAERGFQLKVQYGDRWTTREFRY